MGRSLMPEDLARAAGVLTHAPVRMALIVLLTALGFAAWNLSSQPTYRSSLTLRVEDVTSERPQVEHRAIPMGTVDEGTALTLLRSRTALAKVVQEPLTNTGAEEPVGLGLTTWVTDESAPPLRRLLRAATDSVQPDFRLEAKAKRLTQDAPHAVRLRFVARDRVSVSGTSAFGVEWPKDDPQVLPFVPGKPVVYQGLALTLSPTGLCDDRVWRIERLSEDQAIDRVLARLRVDKQQHQPGTLGVTVLDEDPVRAAAIANAVAKAFVDEDLREARMNAAATVSFLQEELQKRQEVLNELTESERALHAKNPDTIHPDASALELGKREGVWDDLHRKARARRILAERVQQEIDAGAPLQTALAAAGEDHAPEVAVLLKTLNHEEQQLRQVFRGSNDAGYRQTLLLKADDYRIEAERFATRMADLAGIIERLEAGDRSALSRLGGDLARDGSIAVDWNMRLWITELEKTRDELGLLEAEFTDAYPPVATARERVSFYTNQILDGLRALQTGYEATLAQKNEYAASWAELHSSYPDSEAALIRGSIAQLKKEAAAAFAAYVAGLRATEDSTREEVARLRARMRDLADSKEALRHIQLESRELDRVVGELVRDVENARVAAAGIVPSARIIDPARAARAPLKPSASFGVIAGLVLGVLVAVAWAWFDVQREPLDYASSPAAMERLASLTLYGSVPVTGPKDGPPREIMLVRGEAGPAPSWLPMMEAPKSPAAQTYRALRSRLRRVRTAAGDPAKVIGLVSAAAGEGAETVAINLGMARAQLGERVLVIDGQLAAPTLRATIASTGLQPVGYLDFHSSELLIDRETFGHVESARGLGQALEGSAHWSDVAAPSGFPGLDVLFAGSSEVVSADLLASEMFEVLCEEVRSSYDVVLISLPALGEGPDAEAAAAALDGALFLQSEFAGQSHAEAAGAIRRLEEAGGHVLGLVKTLAVERRRRVGGQTRDLAHDQDRAA